MLDYSISFQLLINDSTISPPPGFRVTAFQGVEGISQSFHFKIKFFCEAQISDLHSWLGQMMTLEAKSNEITRYFNGRIKSLCFLLEQAQGCYEYEVELIPWFELLDLKQDCRIFQNLNVSDIVKKLFAEAHDHDYELKLIEEYSPLEYCVQYQESIFYFISRILESHGIFYYFRFDKAKHWLVITDDISQTIVGPELHQVLSWHGVSESQPRCYIQNDYAFKTPNTDLTCAAEVPESTLFALHMNFCQSQYPGGYETLFAGKRSVQHWMIAQCIRHVYVAAASKHLELQAGMKFNISEEGDLKSYLITQINHQWQDRSFLSHHQLNNISSAQSYSNDWICNDVRRGYKPLLSHPAPKITGYQTAIVVGPQAASDTVYTDIFGRIKVQFSWDRYGQFDPQSSCWMRVLQFWAGDGYGAQWLPRVGQEVIVEFLDGDINRPIVCGALTNALHQPPYNLPEQNEFSGIKSNSTNELRFNNQKNHEEILINAARDVSMTIQKNEITQINNNDYLTLDQGSYDARIAGHFDLNVSDHIEFRVGSSYIKITPERIDIAGKTIKIN